MLTGAGEIFFTTNNLDVSSLRGENLMFPGCIASFSLTPDENAVDAECLEGGVIQIADTAITRRTWTMALEFQYVDWTTIQLAYDELAQTLTSVDLPKRKVAIIDENGEVADTDITTGNEAGFLAYLSSPGQKATFLKVVTSSPAVDEVQYNATSSKLILNVANAGKKITYRVNRTYTNVEAIGVADTYDKFGSLAFSGIVGFSNNAAQVGMQLIVPQLNRVSSPEVTVNGDLVSLSLEYRLATPTGSRAPFQLYFLG